MKQFKNIALTLLFFITSCQVNTGSISDNNFSNSFNIDNSTDSYKKLSDKITWIEELELSKLKSISNANTISTLPETLLDFEKHYNYINLNEIVDWAQSLEIIKIDNAMQGGISTNIQFTFNDSSIKWFSIYGSSINYDMICYEVNKKIDPNWKQQFSHYQFGYLVSRAISAYMNNSKVESKNLNFFQNITFIPYAQSISEININKNYSTIDFKYKFNDNEENVFFLTNKVFKIIDSKSSVTYYEIINDYSFRDEYERIISL